MAKSEQDLVFGVEVGQEKNTESQENEWKYAAVEVGDWEDLQKVPETWDMRGSQD